MSVTSYNRRRRWAVQPLANVLGTVARGLRYLPELRQHYSGPNSVTAWNQRLRKRARSSTGSRSTRTSTKRKRMRVSNAKKKKVSFLASGGMYAGRFRKTRINRRSLFKAIKVRTETNSEVSAGAADEVVWLGGTAITAETMSRHMLLACLRKLAKKGGFDFRTEHDYIEKSVTALAGNTGFFNYQASLQQEPALTERSIVIATGKTWGELADLWWTDIKAWLSGVSQVHFHCCWIDFDTRDATTNISTNGGPKLDMRELLIDFNIVSQLKIQNRTGANSPTEVDAENIEQNPIVGKLFVIDGSQVLLNWNNDSTVTPSFAPNSSSGILIIDPNDPSYTDGLANVFKRPSAGNMFRYVKRKTTVRLQPGHIKTHSVVDSGTMYFDNLFHKVAYNAAGGGTGAGDISRFGKMHMFVMDKELRTGTGTAVVKLGYEHNQYHTFSVRRKKPLPYIMEENTA